MPRSRAGPQSEDLGVGEARISEGGSWYPAAAPCLRSRLCPCRGGGGSSHQGSGCRGRAGAARPPRGEDCEVVFITGSSSEEHNAY